MSELLLDSVKNRYGAVAESTLSNDHEGVKAVAEAFGYSAEELTSVPAEANMGLSCGNPQQQHIFGLVRWWSILARVAD
jgi:arsenite methyltransferase